MKEFTVTGDQEGIKCIKYCMKILPKATSGFLYKMLRKKNICLNDHKADPNEVLKTGDVLKFYLSDETFHQFASSDASMSFSANVSPSKNLNSKNTSKKSTSANFVKSASKEIINVNTPKTSNNIFTNSNLRALHIPSLEKQRIVYEDHDILVYNKPQGLLSQKAGPKDISLNEMLIEYLLKEGQTDSQKLAMQRPSVCNRLDRNTSGLVLCGKTYKGLTALSKVLKDRSLYKYYHCMVYGTLDKPLHITAYLSKDEKKNKVQIRKEPFEGSVKIETEIIPLKSNGKISLLKIHLITGKAHQIRAQLAHLNIPIIGDGKYGNKAINKHYKDKYGITYQMLHAIHVSIPDESDIPSLLRGKEFTAAKPKEFTKVEEEL